MAMPDTATAIHASARARSFGSTEAVRAVDLQVDPGEI